MLIYDSAEDNFKQIYEYPIMTMEYAMKSTLIIFFYFWQEKQGTAAFTTTNILNLMLHVAEMKSKTTFSLISQAQNTSFTCAQHISQQQLLH